jgi:hypothetical protein
MSKHYLRILGSSLFTLAAASTAWGQQWELGGVGGASFLSNVPVSGGVAPATAGFQEGFAAGAFLGQNLYPHLSGEFHYMFLQSNLRIQSNGSDASFSGRAHAIHYDLILHTHPSESRPVLFAAAGGGVKVFQGTGQEQAYQPLSQYGYFTNTQVLKPMLSVGGGMKFALSRNVILRTELRDYITPFPTNLIAPAPGMKFGSVLHDLVPMVGLSCLF